MNYFFQHQNNMQNGQGFQNSQENRASQYYPETLSVPENNKKESENSSTLDFSQFQQDFSYLEQNSKSQDDTFFQEKNNYAETVTNFSNLSQQDDSKNENSQNINEKFIKNQKKALNFENLLFLLKNTNPDELLAKTLSNGNTTLQNPLASQLFSNLLSSKKESQTHKNSNAKTENSNIIKSDESYEDL